MGSVRNDRVEYMLPPRADDPSGTLRKTIVGWVKPTGMTARGMVGCTHPTIALGTRFPTAVIVNIVGFFAIKTMKKKIRGTSARHCRFLYLWEPTQNCNQGK